jgi:hypothetical protein
MTYRLRLDLPETFSDIEPDLPEASSDIQPDVVAHTWNSAQGISEECVPISGNRGDPLLLPTEEKESLTKSAFAISFSSKGSRAPITTDIVEVVTEPIIVTELRVSMPKDFRESLGHEMQRRKPKP